MVTRLMTPSVLHPFTLSEAKDHLRATDSEDDGYIQMLIFAVADATENFTRRALFTQTRCLYLDYFPGCEVEIPRYPLQSVTTVKYRDTGGTLTTMSASEYSVDTVGMPARIRPALGTSWPTTSPEVMNSVEITYVCGYQYVGELPPALRQAMLYLLAHFYDVRESVSMGSTPAIIPFTMEHLFAPFKVMTFY